MTRCSCRPGCLTWLRPGDNVTPTPDGYALTAHVAVTPYQDEPAIDVQPVRLAWSDGSAS